MARLVRDELREMIGGPVHLLTINPSEDEISGRFRSNDLLFDYTITGEEVRYGVVRGGTGSARKDGEAQRPCIAQPLRGLLDLIPSMPPSPAAELTSRLDAHQWAGGDPDRATLHAFIGGLTGWPAERVSGYLDAGTRADAAKSKKNCGQGFGCGSTCIARDKRCIKTAKGGLRIQTLQNLLQHPPPGREGMLRAKEAKAGREAVQHGRYKGYDTSPPGNQKADPPRFPGSAIRAARSLRGRLARVEPDITKQMIDLADTHGAKMAGLAYRLKAEKSLARKINDEMNPPKKSAAATAETMSDVVRYTMTTSNERYVATVQAVVNDFVASGAQARVKNYWSPGQPYRGINVALTMKDGTKVELQFHTPASLKIKHKTHPIYSAYREERDNGKRRQMFEQMVKINNSLKTPWSAGEHVNRRSSTRARKKREVLSLGTLKKMGFLTWEDEQAMKAQ